LLLVQLQQRCCNKYYHIKRLGYVSVAMEVYVTFYAATGRYYRDGTGLGGFIWKEL
jgi:hypothetical protein